MKKKKKSLWLLFACLLFIPTICPTTNSQNIEDFEVTGVTVYRVYPFSPTEEYELKTIFLKNYSYANFSIDIPWSTPFSFNSTKRQMILENIENNPLVSPNTIIVYSRNGTSSQNEYISFDFKDKPNYGCIVFPTMLIGTGELTGTNEYISISDMNQRRNDFLSFFENFIMSIPQLHFYFQQKEFLSGESLPRESVVWTRIIRVSPNFNYLSDEQLIDFLHFRTFEFEKALTEDKLKMMISSSISSDYINEVVLFDGYNLGSWKTYYNYPLGLNENIIQLRMLTELNYVLLPYALDKLSELQKSLDSLENNLTNLNGKSPDEIKNSGTFEVLTDYKTTFRELQHLDISIKLRNTDNLFEMVFGPEINNQYEESSVYLEDINTQYYFLKDYYNDLLNSAFTDSAIKLQIYAIITAIVFMILTITLPSLRDWLRYNYSTPDFSVHFKPTLGKTFEELKMQEIELSPNKEELVWVMLHNNGKVITDNWFCIIDFEKGFDLIPIEETQYSDVDFVKHYTIQEKYNAAHFNSTDFSPLIPYDETVIFPIALKTPNKLEKFPVRVTVLTGNHKNKFIHHLFIIINNSMKKETIIKQFASLKGIGEKKAELIYENGFDSIEKLKKASANDLKRITGISEKIASDIIHQLKKQCK